ncbi:exodeoxyribonuclease VII small subunit [Methylobacterium radiotolerans]|nr:exodeoxyribonuclease VII small subunit [Methylobacterium radiotolerans]
MVRRLERGDVPLDESVAIYERGEVLKKHCEALLKRAAALIQLITLGSDGQPEGVDPHDKSRSEEHTSALDALRETAYAGFCGKKRKNPPGHPCPAGSRQTQRGLPERRAAGV